MQSISKQEREDIKPKYGGKCAFSGTDLESDWQVDHVKQVVRNWWIYTACFDENHTLDNMIPCQRIINHYKHSMGLTQFREMIATLHLRLRKAPKNPRSEKTAKRKVYIFKVASYFGITEDKPFSGIFYFESCRQN